MQSLFNCHGDAKSCDRKLLKTLHNSLNRRTSIDHQKENLTIPLDTRVKNLI